MEFIDQTKAMLASARERFMGASFLKKIAVIVVLSIAGWFTVTRFTGKMTQAPQYQTAQAQKGTLIVSLSASGLVSSANRKFEFGIWDFRERSSRKCVLQGDLFR